ncbi:DUF2207 family protein [Streptococcus dentapri]|uniref:DUF2207 family protein n=1 Tax=Streptococcus dentapri TaxID=573564 RepID=A0ABV8D1N1_9STRE
MKVLKKIVILVALFLGILSSSAMNVYADDVEYSIPSYIGDLAIHQDNSAIYRQRVTYHFDSSYKGQYVSLGTAGKMPKGFTLSGPPTVRAYKNGKEIYVSSNLENLGDGYRLKVYNSGQEGDTVELDVEWQLSNMLFKYQDIAELNWSPISNWDVRLDKVEMNVSIDGTSKQSQLVPHRGYLQDTPRVTKENNTYHIAAQNVHNRLELHAYWDTDIIEGASLPGRHLDDFRKLENKIGRANRRRLFLVNAAIPLILMVSLVLLCVCYYRLKKALTRYYFKPVRLYEMPADLSPLAVMQMVYNQSVFDLSAFGKAMGRKPVTFDNLLQAELLDLIDRKALVMEEVEGKYWLTIGDTSQLSDYEDDFISWAFGENLNLPVSSLFSDYHFDEDAKRRLKKAYSGSELEGQMRSAGNKITNAFKVQAKRISQEVKAQVDSFAPASYRKLSKKERGQLNAIGVSLTIMIIIPIVVTVYLLIHYYFHLITLFYILLSFSLIVILFLFLWRTAFYRYSGVLTPEGGRVRLLWDSFDKMMADIGTFEKAELESLIIWNRMLVYATLFGHADKVERYMELHSVQLSDYPITTIYPYLAPQLYLATSQFNNSITAANSASHFSVSSGSSGFGGFSGGGGGGGGGAF